MRPSICQFICQFYHQNRVLPTFLCWLIGIYVICGAEIREEEEELESIQPTQAPPFDPNRDNFTLAGLTKKEWEGPYYQEALLGSVIHLPCTLTPAMIDRLLKMRKLAASEKYYWSLLWVHQNWEQVIDPWKGDGRRSYDKLQVVPYWKTDLSLSLEKARLSILDAKPSDNGIYACIVAMYPLEKGLSPVVLSQSDLVSMHILRIKSGYIANKDCDQKGSEENIYCETGFEDWTQNVYYPSGINKGDIIFQAPCNADLFLTAMALGGVDPTFWSIGWRFVPVHATDNTGAVEMDEKLEMKMQAPVHLCMEDSTTPCFSSNQNDRAEPLIGKHDLALAHAHAAKLWKARWLVLTGTVPQSSGRWQCWVQGLGMTMHPKAKSITVRWFIDEVHVKIIPESDLYTWWSTVEFWRVLGLVASPMIFVLIGIIMAVGRTAAYLHPDKIPKKKHIKLLLDKTDDLTTIHSKQGKDSDDLEPNAYMHTFLAKQGIESYLVTAARDKNRGLLFR